MRTIKWFAVWIHRHLNGIVFLFVIFITIASMLCALAHSLEHAATHRWIQWHSSLWRKNRTYLADSDPDCCAACWLCACCCWLCCCCCCCKLGNRIFGLSAPVPEFAVVLVTTLPLSDVVLFIFCELLSSCILFKCLSLCMWIDKFPFVVVE